MIKQSKNSIDLCLLYHIFLLIGSILQFVFNSSFFLFFKIFSIFLTITVLNILQKLFQSFFRYYILETTTLLSLMTQKIVLYQDDSVRITADQLTILQYYFPLPVNKTINMCDIKEVNLKTDVNKHLQYIEVVVAGFSMNATFSPTDPKKVIQIIKAHSCFELSGKNIQQATSNQDVKSQPGILTNVQNTLAQGWQNVKQVSHNIYQTTAEKIHQMTSPETEAKARQAKQEFKEGAQNLKEGASKKVQQGKQQFQQATGTQKTTYENIKQTVAEGWQNIKQGAQNVYEKAAQKVSQFTQPVEQKTTQAKYDIKQGAHDTKESLKQNLLPQKPLTQQAKQKTQQMVGTDATGKAKDAKQHFKKGAQDAGESIKKATGYEGSALQQANQNFAKGWQKTKQSASNAYQNTKQSASNAYQNAKQNIAQGWQNTKQTAQNVYDNTSKKLSDVGSNIQQKAGQKTKQAGQALKQKGQNIEKNA